MNVWRLHEVGRLIASAFRTARRYGYVLSPQGPVLHQEGMEAQLCAFPINKTPNAPEKLLEELRRVWGLTDIVPGKRYPEIGVSEYTLKWTSLDVRSIDLWIYDRRES